MAFRIGEISFLFSALILEWMNIYRDKNIGFWSWTNRNMAPDSVPWQFPHLEFQTVG